MIYLHKTQLYNKHENPNYALNADNYFCARLQRVSQHIFQTWGQLLSNVIDYITIAFQFSWLHYITITSIFKCNRLNYNHFVNVIDYITDYI
jgi:large-conductance mechanosensitive channel